MAGVASTSCAIVDLPVAGSRVSSAAVPKKLTPPLALSSSVSSAGAPYCRSPRSRRSSTLWLMASPGGSVLFAAAAASTALSPTLMPRTASVRWRVP